MAQKTLGVMVDCSRNGVMKPEKVKEFAKLISGMGYNMLQLYTEDTYEIKGEPFFGYMRGRYSCEELKDIDAYCTSIGVELVPCIQVLAHLNQIVRWEDYAPLFDCHDILLAGDEKVYELIDKMFTTLEECFTTRRVNVGMDEAHFIGRGKYQDIHGYRERVEILAEHLARVKEIAARHGFTIMMWSDMFFRINNNGEYYGKDIVLPEKTIAQVPEGVELVYWDYYSKDKETYDHMMSLHEKFNNPTAFAGGVYTWRGFTPNNRYSLDTTEAAMRGLQGHSVDNIFFTMWGDDGSECLTHAALPALFAAAKMAEGNFDREDIAKQFEEKYGYTFEEFLDLELPNSVKDEPTNSDTPHKYLLFNDPFLGLYDFSVPDGVAKRMAAASEKLSKSVNGREFDYLFDAMAKLAKVLSRKADLGVRIRKAYHLNDREGLAAIVEEMTVLRGDLRAFTEAFKVAWLKERKAFGLEVQEQRLGGLMYRLESCQLRLKSYLAGDILKVDELEEECLVMKDCKPGETQAVNSWGRSITAGILSW